MGTIKKVKLKNLKNSIWNFTSKNTKTTYNKLLIMFRPFKVRIVKLEWKSLRDSLISGYEPKKYGYITVRNNRVVNGNHRLILLKEMYPENKEIEIKTESFVVYNLIQPLKLIVFPVAILVLIVTYIPLKLKNIINNLNKKNK